MDAKDRLVMFMAAKSIIIDKELGREMQYFTPEDAASISKWSDEDAESVLDRMVVCDVLNDADMCPFCWYCTDATVREFDCNKCDYALHHGRCCSPQTNTYDMICNVCGSLAYVMRPYERELNAILFKSDEEVDAAYASIINSAKRI